MTTGKPPKGVKDTAAPPRPEAAATLGVTADIILPAVAVALPSILIGDNWDEYNPGFGAHLRRDIYSARTAKLDPIALVCLPCGTLLYGGSFAVLVDGRWLSDQVHRDWQLAADGSFDEGGNGRPVIDVATETVLVARFGVATWGHWLGELLPRIVLAERCFPGRFSYTLPRSVFSQPEGTIWGAIRQSIAAYGIALDRCVPIDGGCNYRFRAAHAVTSVWSDRLMHPAAGLVMRQAICLPVPAPELLGGRMSLLRTETSSRQIANLAEIAGLLAGRGYKPVKIGLLPFLEQVGLFRAATSVVSVLGSGLTGLLYSPEGLAVASLAPDNFGDSFFYALAQNRRARYFDLRGPAVPGHEHMKHWNPFSISVATLTEALDRLDATGG
ncbi:MAG: glycosyltransferase family 61 protein [Alphaproteobacteria bacterium]|nr:glycosyltransferase family 61 protein [Alphaproteobacteria bacterium]